MKYRVIILVLIFVLILGLILSFAGCKTLPVFCRSETFLAFFPICRTFEPFTDELRETFENRLSDLQFFISDQIVLSREIETEEISIGNRTHRVRIKNNRKLIKIIIKKETRGVLKKAEGDTLHIQFESLPDGKERTIPFTRKKESEETAGEPGYYVYEFKDPEVSYEGKTYTVSFSERDVPVHEKDISVYVDKEGKQAEEHYIKEPVYPVLLVDLVLHRIREKERRKAPGLSVE